MTTNHLDLSAIEKKVETIWKEVLEMPKGQTGATFFDLKGDSISAVRLVSRIEDELGILIEVGDIFEEDPDLPTLLRDVLAKAVEAAAA